ncbi:MAG: class I SAM-dependent methyltransferase [Acidobacteria bacterium]|nr:class I SAM-dependent methyltransferase [Acidobacteriota bacterium]
MAHPQRHYLGRINELLQDETHWLDLGCGRNLVPRWLQGHAELEAELVACASLLVGADLDLSALRDNRSCHVRLLATATALPFADGSFDLVTSNMVFEHIEKPQATLAEIRRVLQPDGTLLIVTPNWLDIVSLMAQLVPNRWHGGIVSRVETRQQADVYPTFFRFNNPRTIARRLREAGFTRWHVKQLMHPNVYDHVPIVAGIEHTWHKLAQWIPEVCGALLIEAVA